MHDKKLRILFCGRLIVPEHTGVILWQPMPHSDVFQGRDLSKGKLQCMYQPVELHHLRRDASTPLGSQPMPSFGGKNPNNMRNLIPCLRGYFQNTFLCPSRSGWCLLIQKSLCPSLQAELKHCDSLGGCTCLTASGERDGASRDL